MYLFENPVNDSIDTDYTTIKANCAQNSEEAKKRYWKGWKGVNGGNSEDVQVKVTIRTVNDSLGCHWFEIC